MFMFCSDLRLWGFHSGDHGIAVFASSVCLLMDEDKRHFVCVCVCVTSCDIMDCSTRGFPVLHYLPELLKFMSTESVMLSTISSSAVLFFFCLCVCDIMWHHGLQHTELPCPSLSARVAQIHVHWVSDAIYHLILCCPLLLLPSLFPSIKVFSSESGLCIR